MPINNINMDFKKSEDNSFVTLGELFELNIQPEIKAELRKEIKDDDEFMIHIGNSKDLLNTAKLFDEQLDKIDQKVKMGNVSLDKSLDKEKAIFLIAGCTEKSITNNNNSDLISATTIYSARKDILNYQGIYEFANKAREKNTDEYKAILARLVSDVASAEKKNLTEKSLRLLYDKAKDIYYIRAITSANHYKDYGINFSIIVTLYQLNKIAISTSIEIFIDKFHISDSEIYISFDISRSQKLRNDAEMSIKLIMENNEIKRDSFSLSGSIQINYQDSKFEFTPDHKFLKSKNVNLLNIIHRGKLSKALSKISDIEEYISAFSNQAQKIDLIIPEKDCKDIWEIILKAIHDVRNETIDKTEINKRTALIIVNTTVELYKGIGIINDYFNQLDITAFKFWKDKLASILIKRK